MICFAFPVTSPPEGSYLTAVTELGSGWRGEIVSDFQHPTRLKDDLQGEEVSTVVPMSEESVLATGFANSYLGLPGLSLNAAMRCTYRLFQRTTIASIDPSLNPEWREAGTDLPSRLQRDVVIKAGASTYNRGIVFSDAPTEEAVQKATQGAYYELARLRRCGVNRPSAIIEERLEGEQYEVSGIVDRFGHIVRWFQILRQTWDGDRIVNYEVVKDQDDLIGIARKLVHGFRLRECCFNIEIRGGKVVEIQPRLGEDNGSYYELLAPGESISQVVYDCLA